MRALTHGGVDAQLEKGRYGYVHLAVHGFTELTESCPEHISLFALHVFEERIFNTIAWVVTESVVNFVKNV